MKLIHKDYKDILSFYKVNTSNMKPREIKEKAEHLLATKLCKCIKSIKYNTSTTASGKRANASLRANASGKRANASGKRANASGKRANAGEKRAIAICYNSVIRQKGLKTFKFKCKSGVKLLPKKGTRKLKLIKA
jgi:hypothetical protein